MVPKKKLTVPKEERRRAGRNELVQINIHTLLFIKSSRTPMESVINELLSTT